MRKASLSVLCLSLLVLTGCSHREKRPAVIMLNSDTSIRCDGGLGFDPTHVRIYCYTKSGVLLGSFFWGEVRGYSVE